MARPRLRRRRGSSRSRGFSLIEVMIALTFLSIGLLAVAQMIPLGLVGVTQARVRTSAVQAAQQKIDALRAADFSAVELTAGDYTETDGNYTLGWTITDNTPVTGVKRVDLTASWQHLGNTKSLTLNTQITAGQ